jgi:hypothetical protein
MKMDPEFASVVLGFFALVIALVAVAYRQNDVARAAITELRGVRQATNPEQDENDPQA